MKERDADRLRAARLLSGREGPSSPERDAMFEHVLARVEAPKRGFSRARLLFAGVAAIAACVLAVLVLPRDEFASRGAGTEQAVLRAVCPGARPATCRAGDTMMFEVAPPTEQQRWFAALAQRGETMIWYVPATPDGASVKLKDRVLDVGIVIGAEHVTGAWKIQGVFSDRPLRREEIRAAADGVVMPGVRTVVREIEVVR
jgi:hypothetical protein